MAKFVPDVKTQRWVVIAPGRTARPSQVHGEPSVCPFCFGNEALTPPEVSRVNGKSSSDWLVRVVPNKYPITDIHEVVIHCADHKLDLIDLPLSHVEIIFKAYRDRFR